MKKTILLFAVGFASAALISGHVYAQDTSTRDALAGSPTVNARALTAPANGSIANTEGVSTINLRAIKDLKQRFTSIKDEHWYSVKAGFQVYFTENGFRVRAHYDKKGRWQATFKYCDESILPRDTRAMVRSTYYDFAITLVQIVEIPGHMVYLIHLDDANNHKIVRVSGEGDMDVLQEFQKHG
jgi:hypothetical protein